MRNTRGENPRRLSLITRFGPNREKAARSRDIRDKSFERNKSSEIKAKYQQTRETNPGDNQNLERMKK